MKRLILILLLTTSLLALTSAVVYASPTMEPERQDDIDLDDAIGTLGLYAALMAVLAVGTEIVIDTVRPVFGLQRKATTAESLKKLNDWLPGATKELGLSAEAQARIDGALGELEKVTEDFQQNADKAQLIVQEEWPNILKDLAVKSANEVLTTHWPVIEGKLQAQGITDTTAVNNWLVGALNKIGGTSINDLQGQLGLLNGVMNEVAKQRNEIQGPTRKLWRQLRNALIKIGERMGESRFRHLFFLPAYVEAGWARLWGKLKFKAGETWETVIKRLGTAEDVTERVATNLQDAAKLLLEEDAKNRQEETNRVKWLRIISAVVGVAVAYALKIDSLQLLEPLLQDTVETFKVTPEGTEWKTIEALTGSLNLALPILDSVVDWVLNLTPGILLSGLGAAAGSGFWHDRLDNLRAAKGVAQTVEEVTKSVSGEGEKK